MIRTRVPEKKIEAVIKKGASVAQPKKKSISDSAEVTKNVQLRLPIYLIEEIDKLRGERKKKRLEFGKSRHDFLIEAILGAVNQGFEDLKKV